jgi:NAD(P)-dependent dehydrogenase (short-subunit alcohol dehydrogenase family)
VKQLPDLLKAYDFAGRSAIVTGGAGVLGGEIACSLAECGVSVAILDREPQLAERWMGRLNRSGSPVKVEYCDVLDKSTVEFAIDTVLKDFGSIDWLINGAGGNSPGATTAQERTFFELPTEALRFVFDLNILGTMIPSQVAARHMVAQGEGAILNISSMNASRPLTRIPAYSAAKAGVSNFTQWLAVHMAQEYSPGIRVNAIAPGFFLTEQNRFLLTEQETGELTPRGSKILDHTPMQRFGKPEDLIGAVFWLLSPASSFVTGVILPIDGGFQAYSGV